MVQKVRQIVFFMRTLIKIHLKLDDNLILRIAPRTLTLRFAAVPLSMLKPEKCFQSCQLIMLK